jgi:hypothetical protein
VSFATVKVHVEVDGKSHARIRLAAELADRFGSHLIGIAACILPSYPAEGAYFVTGEAVERERRDIKASLARAEVAFRTTAGVDRPGHEWRCDIALPDTYVAFELRAADLLIVGRRSAPADVSRTPDPGSVVLRAGRPVLVVPPNLDTLQAERVIIGWKDCLEAQRAAVPADSSEMLIRGDRLRARHGGPAEFFRVIRPPA